MKIKVSVIIPVFNGELYLEQCIGSVLAQNIDDFEIILIDDGSTDSSLGIIENYAKDDSRINVIKLDKNCGLGYARNIALNQANGKYIFFLDCDDWLEEDAIRVSYEKAVEKNSQTVLFGHNNCPMSASGSTQVIEAITPILEENDADFFRHSMLTTKGLRPMVWGYLYLKQFLLDNNINFIEGIFFEDVLFTTKAIYYSSSIGVIQKPLYNYRIHNSSITKTFSKKKIDDCFTAHLGIKSFLEKEKSYEKYKTEFVVRFLSCCFSLCFTNFLIMPNKERDRELKNFMEKARKSHMMHSSNLLLIKKVALELDKSEQVEKNFFENTFDFLSTIKYKYKYKYLKLFYALKRFFVHNLKLNFS